MNKLKKIIAQRLDLSELDFTYPPNKEWGDLSFPLFKISQEKKISVQDLSKKISEDIAEDKELNKIVEKVELKGAYLNFFITNNYLFSQVFFNIFENKDNYGHNQDGDSEVAVFEYSNVNTHKSFHIGHLRNVCLGQSIVNIFSANGYKAHPVSYINDFGVHTAKAVWSYKRKYSENLNKCYANTVQEIKKNPDIAIEVTEIMTNIEKRKGDDYNTWKKTRRQSLREFKEVYKLLKVNFKKTYFESEVIDRGFSVVEELINKKILVKSQGAIIADLESHNLGVLPVIRSDGTALYPVADLALAEYKNRDFKNLKYSYIIVDVRQSLHFQQLFKVLSLAGAKQDFFHLPYEFITLPDGMLSSRSGNAISFFEVYQKVYEKLKLETKKRQARWSDRKINKNCHKLAVAILKFEMIKVATKKIITFDINRATEFEGFSALYVLYGLVRIKSILRKGDFRSRSKTDFSLLQDKLEKDIIIKLSKYPETIKKARQDYDPSEVAKYLFELVKTFNDYYQNVKVITNEQNLKKSRLKFLYAISLVIENGLKILDIEVVKEI